jgi:uncharacterized protein (UPF0261 family)
MRTTIEENIRIGTWMAAKLNQMEGPVRFLLPRGGLSAIGISDMPFHDPQADAALFETLRSLFKAEPQRRLIDLPWAINDPLFARAIIDAFLDLADQ